VGWMLGGFGGFRRQPGGEGLCRGLDGVEWMSRVHPNQS